MSRALRPLLLLVLAPFALACHGGTIAAGDGGTDGPPADDGPPPGDDIDAASDGPLPPPAPVSKLDLLFMIDNSASMGDKQALVAEAVPDMIRRLVTPNCVDAQGNVVGVSQGGQCSQGMLEFQPVNDMHIGIVTSSLGGRGSDQCDSQATNPANPSLNAHNDDRGHLINRTGANETPSPDASPANFLAWLPNVPQNQGQPQPPVPPIGDAVKLIGDFTDLISGVHEHGCGFEAQLESWYRFLVQPDPFDQIVKNGTKASFQGVDQVILQQRHDFLRPDSALAVVVVTDESEEVADPLAIGGQGWAFANTAFPGSPNGAAPKGTIECSNAVVSGNASHSGPNDPSCTSCAFLQGQPNFATECPGGAYLDPTDDNLNVRFFQQKRRFGLFAGYPVDRYVIGLSQPTVPSVMHSGPNGSSDHEHDSSGQYYGDCTYSQDDTPTHSCVQHPKAPDGTDWTDCTNPIFATNLPTDPSADLCHLQRGPRTASQVFFAAITGVPHQLLQTDPKDPNSPQKSTLSAADWVNLIGADPEHYDFSGADFHMLESETDRMGSQCPSATAADDCDPMNGREWDTGKGDLQFACIFDIRPQYGGVGKDCSDAAFTGACDCATNSQSRDTPLCQKNPNDPNADFKGYTNIQINGKAYPSVRELELARDLGGRAVVSSLCPIHVQDNAQSNDPLFGYRPAMQALIDRLATTLKK